MRAIRGPLAAAFLAVLFALPVAAQSGELKCPSCGRVYADGAKFCLDDGTRLVPKAETCPNCGSLRTGNARFCGSCGYNFEKPPQPRTEEAKPVPAQPRERICAKCGRKATPGMKFCAGCGGPLPKEEAGAPASGPGAPEAQSGERQWASAVVGCSSQGGAKSFAASQIVGPPDVERPGRDGRAWCPSLARRGPEWITVRFARPAVPRAIRIHETSAQGFVTRIDAIVGGREVLWWEGEDRANPRQNILEAVSTVPVGAIDMVKITIDTKKVRAWTEIDAVELIASAPAGPGRRDGLERIPPRTGPSERNPQPGVEGDAHSSHGTGGGPSAGARFARPDDCFEAWKQAILDYDSGALAACYVAQERRAIEQEPDIAQAIFSRYGEALRRNDFSIVSRSDLRDEVVWVLDIRVKEASWSQRVKEKLRFRVEAGDWRLQIERG